LTWGGLGLSEELVVFKAVRRPKRSGVYTRRASEFRGLPSDWRGIVGRGGNGERVKPGIRVKSIWGKTERRKSLAPSLMAELGDMYA